MVKKMQPPSFTPDVMGVSFPAYRNPYQVLYKPICMVFFCEQCGAHVTGDMRFCEQCGARLPFNPGSPPTYPPAPTTPVASSTPGTSGWFSTLVPKPKKHRKSPDYSKVVLWIQDKYRSSFSPGMDPGRVQSELEAIINRERKSGIPEEALKAFRLFIEQQQYGMFRQPGR